MRKEGMPDDGRHGSPRADAVDKRSQRCRGNCNVSQTSHIKDCAGFVFPATIELCYWQRIVSSEFKFHYLLQIYVISELAWYFFLIETRLFISAVLQAKRKNTQNNNPDTHSM